MQGQSYMESYSQLIRQNGDFRSLWFGQIVSLLGDWFTLIAAAILTSNLTQSSMAVGGLFALRMLSPFFASPIAGVVIDRYNRKKLLIMTDVTRAVVVLGFLWVRDASDVWLLYALTAVHSAISAFFFPARDAMLPSIVKRKELGHANALSSATWSVMLALGTGLGGLVAGGFGVYMAFLIDSLSFCLSGAFIAQIRYRDIDETDGVNKGIGPAFSEYVAGLRYIWNNLDILYIVLHKAVLCLISGALMVVQVALADRVFMIGKGGGISMGIIFAVVGMGTGIGPIMAGRYTRDRGRAIRVAIAIAYVLNGAGVALAATLSSFGVVLAGIFVRGIGGGTVWVLSTQLLMELLADHIRGRVFATEFAVFTLMSAMSVTIGGWSVDSPLVGLTRTMWCVAGLSLIPAGLWAWYITSKKFVEASSSQERQLM